MPIYDAIIVGAGIVGLATAYHLHGARPGIRLLVIEKEDGPGQHQTGHNSGVIHAGVYYAPGSLKARLCTAGSARTRAFCAENGVAYDSCGKLIVATEPDELPRLEALMTRATANGLDLRMLDAAEMAEIEPKVAGLRAILSPDSGIVDYGEICRALKARLWAEGVDFRFGTKVTGLVEAAGEIRVETAGGDIAARVAIACAGLAADRIAALSGLADDFRVVPFRGEYFRLSPRAGDLVQRLIYPVPDPSLPFLGVHLTKMIGGYTTVGPNAVFSFGRETYDGNRFVARDAFDSLSFPGFWKLMARSLRPGLHELKGSLSRRAYLERCRRYCPELTLDDLEPHAPGIRAQAVGRDGKMIEDFLVRETPRTVHVCNAPSPAATSAFPIGEEIGAKVLAKLAA